MSSGSAAYHRFDLGFRLMLCQHRICHRFLLFVETGDHDSAVGHRLLHDRGSIKQNRQYVFDFLISRTRQQASTTDALELPSSLKKLAIVSLIHELIKVRMPNKRRLTASLFKPLDLKRQFTQHVVHELANLADPPTRPRPHLRYAVIEHRDAVLFGFTSNPPVESLDSRSARRHRLCFQRST